MEPKKADGRSLGDFEPLNLGERKLLEACRSGSIAVLGERVPLPLPMLEPQRILGPVDVPSPVRMPITKKNSVRADFLRFLLLGGDEQAPIHERGVRMRGGYVQGLLNLSGCNIPFGVSLQKCFFPSAIIARDAKIGGLFNLGGCYLAAELNADRLKCAAGLFLRDGFIAKEAVRLPGVQVDGNFDCSGGHFESQVEKSLNVGRANIVGDVFLKNGFQSKGEVILRGAQIGGNLECLRGNFVGRNGRALSAERVSVSGNLNLGQGFVAKGEVFLLGARIGGNLECAGGHFERRDRYALSADGANISGDVNLGNGFLAKGQVRLLGAQILGNLDCSSGHFESKKDDALVIEAAVIRGAWFISGLSLPVSVNASHANVAILVDELNAWAKGSTFDGFRYGAFGDNALTGGEDRIAWLYKQHEDDLSKGNFCPQPWRQLQSVLREMGHVEDAKLVGIALENHLREIGRRGKDPKDLCDLFNHPEKVMAFIAHVGFGKLAGYGYRPVRLVSWMLGVWLGFAAAYSVLAQQPFNAIAPSDPLVFQKKDYEPCRPNQLHTAQAEVLGNWTSCSLLPGEYSTFSALAYSLDLLLPVVDLGQENSWGSYIPSPDERAAEESIANWRWGYVVRVMAWFETLFGWVSSLLLVAIISGFSRRNDEG